MGGEEGQSGIKCTWDMLRSGTGYLWPVACSPITHSQPGRGPALNQQPLDLSTILGCYPDNSLKSTLRSLVSLGTHGTLSQQTPSYRLTLPITTSSSCLLLGPVGVRRPKEDLYSKTYLPPSPPNPPAPPPPTLIVNVVWRCIVAAA